MVHGSVFSQTPIGYWPSWEVDSTKVIPTPSKTTTRPALQNEHARSVVGLIQKQIFTLHKAVKRTVLLEVDFPKVMQLCTIYPGDADSSIGMSKLINY